MTIRYRVYANALPNGPVDRSSPLGDTAGLTFDTPFLAPDGVHTFVVAPYDDATGYEDPSNDARAAVPLGPDGADLSALPSPPFAPRVRPLAGGAARVTWSYPPGGGAAGFHVYLGAGGAPPDYSSPAATVASPPGTPPQLLAATLSGLTGGTAYSVAVRAFNAAGEEPSTLASAFTAASAGPPAPVPLASSATP